MAGDAARALLRLYGFGEIAAEIKAGKPYSNRVDNAINALTAGTDSHWEVVESDGSHNEPSAGRSAASHREAQQHKPLRIL